ncbi:TPA: prolyl-tRNA synthetase [Candidatus Saccharibacteria bacterium]|nr:prolyl-tRNA synthetase [Candidatus Saccharibacteria bacterium]HIO87226.1 prolyl-tRNA synthetase [Candidatus Saccharibacteria bacterium]
MRYSKLFSKTQKNSPADEVSKNAQLLMRAGFIHKEMAGVYAYLPLGIRVVEKIKQIVREEMNAIDSTELIMTNLQRPDIWEQTDRWDDENVDVWFKTKLQDGTDLGLAWSHEEPILEMMRQHVVSYKDLPVSVYQFQTKLRNELRAKSGIMRGREFVMKDMYSLHSSQEDMDRYYDSTIEAYKKIYDRLGIGQETFVTFASGGAFTKFSHEFQTICPAGEDTLYVNEDKTVAVNEEVLDDATKEIGVDKTTLKAVTTAEVGNIFKFGTEKSEKLNINFTDTDGTQKPVFLASYGVGITRVMGVIVEKYADEHGMVWPEQVAPFAVHLVSIGDKGQTQAESLYSQLTELGIEVFYDDREVSPGQKLGDADLMGMPHRVVASNKTAEKNSFEYKARTDNESAMVSYEQILEKLTK